MNKFFLEDNPVNMLLTKVFDLCLLNILAFLFCLPVVTAGASITALYAVMLPMSENKEGSIVKSFVKQFRENLKSSIRMWMVLLVIGVLFSFDLYVWTKIESPYRSMFFGFTIAMLIAYAVIGSWYFGLRATFVDSGKTSLMNAVKYVVLYLPASALMGIYTAGIVYIYLQQGFIAMFIPVFGIVLVEYPKAWYMRKKFNAYIEDHEEIYGKTIEKEEQERYEEEKQVESDLTEEKVEPKEDIIETKAEEKAERDKDKTTQNKEKKSVESDLTAEKIESKEDIRKTKETAEKDKEEVTQNEEKKPVESDLTEEKTEWKKDVKEGKEKAKKDEKMPKGKNDLVKGNEQSKEDLARRKAKSKKRSKK